MPRITITDGSGGFHDVTGYYDFNQAAYTFTETYDPQRGRSKTATLTLFGMDSSLVKPLEDNVIHIYSDVAGTNLVFGGVISNVERTIIGGDADFWYVDYQITAVGYDPQTENYIEVVNYQRTGILSGQVIQDLLVLFAPWISITNVQVSGSPIIRQISINHRQLSSVIQDIVSNTGWSYYVDDQANAYFNVPSSLPMNWGLTEGVAGATFPECDPATIQIQPNVQDNPNDITIIGGSGKGSKIVETFTFNGQDAIKPLQSVPFGLSAAIQFYDAFDQSLIDTSKWYINDAGAKLTESLGRLQVNDLVSNTAIIVSLNLFSRQDNVELRFAEFQIYDFTSGKATIGIHGGQHATTANDFIHALEFDQTAGTLHVREGATVTNFSGISIGVGIYATRIRVKSTGGAVYYIQGGRTSIPAELGTLGSKQWTKVTETSSDTTAFLAAALRFDQAIGCTVIRAKVATDVNVSVTIIAPAKLGTTTISVNTLLFCGVQQALDYETDCFVAADNSGNATLQFFSDDVPIGNVLIAYWGTDQKIRERVYDSTNKSAVLARSPLPGDTGTRVGTEETSATITDSQDARNMAVAFLQDQSKYKGQFTTDSFKLGNLIPVGNRPVAGRLININLPTTLGYASFNEVITSVQGTDIGTGDIQYVVQFGQGNITFQRYMLKVTAETFIDIIDDPTAAVPVPSEDVSTAGTPRISSPDYATATFDGTGVSISWTSVSGASKYELRDNTYVGQGQGGSLIYQQTSSTSYTISASTIKTVLKRRSFTFYVWSITTGGQYSKYPLVITVENPPPDPQPIRDLSCPDGVTIEIYFNQEVEPDILSSGRVVQIDATDDTMTHLIVNTNYSKTPSFFDYNATKNTTYYLRYGLQDDYTASLGDIEYSGIRQITTGPGDFTNSAQFMNNTPPDNVTANLVVTSALTTSGLDATATLTFDYTQGGNIATAFALVFKIGGGTPSIADPSFMVPARNATGQKFTLQMPHGQTVSFAVIPVAVTSGGITVVGGYQTSVNQVIANGDATINAGTGGLTALSVTTNTILPESGDMNITTTGSSSFGLVYKHSGSDRFRVNNIGLIIYGTQVIDTSGNFVGTGVAATLLTGTINDSRLSTNVLLVSSSLPAANLSGTVADARLTGNVMLANATISFSGVIDALSGNGKLKLRQFGSLASFKANVIAGETCNFADSGVFYTGYFDGGTYFATAYSVV